MSIRVVERVLVRPGETRRIQVRWDGATNAPTLVVADYWCDGSDVRTLLPGDVGARPEHVADLANSLIAEARRERWEHARESRTDDVTAQEICALGDELQQLNPTPLADTLFS